MALSIVTLNANGLRDQSKRAGLVQWFRSLTVVPDIVCLQECHYSSDLECQAWFRASGYLCALAAGSTHARGCIILFRPTLSLVQSWSEPDGRFLMCEFRFCNQVFRCCVYAPNSNPQRNQFLDDVSVRIDPSVPTVLAGDFNTVFDRSLDRRGSDPFDVSRESSCALNRLLNACSSIDIWRYLHPTSSSYTWTRSNGSLSSRIDFILVPHVWVPSVSSCDIVACPFSDHCAVVMSVRVPEVPSHGPGVWKLNLSVLNDPEYVSLITNFWSDWRAAQPRFPTLAKWWDKGKSIIKGLTIRYCCVRSSQRSQHRSLLSRLADHLKCRVDAGFISCLGPYRSTLAEIARMDIEVARGAQVRARARWVEEGETSSAFFLRLEKKQASDWSVAALRTNDGSIVSHNDDLCRVFSSFYESLFTAEATDPAIANSLLSNVSSTLPSTQADLCDGPLSFDECFAALNGMARGKSPGSDGLPMEFYVKFWPILGTDLVNVLNSCYLSGVMSLTQRRGLISLIFKKGDRLDPRNWRPITLLNVDYKLAARVVAGRLLKVIHLVVAKDQTCGVPGRFIGENVSIIRDVVSFASRTGVPLAILSLDQEKAFDRVDWGFMRATLGRMGFKYSFLRWVGLFYTQVQSAVIVNGDISPFFSLSRGVRQGCPLSPLLYVLVAETLAVNIRCNSRIPGLCLPGVPLVVSPVHQYADDTTLILSTDDSIKAVFDIYSLFEKASGSRLNQSKSKGLWLGSWVGRVDPPVALDWSPSKLKILGIYVGLGNLEEDNWGPRICAVEKTLLSWRQRNLSFRGKALVINALALSRIWYVASLVHMPPWVLRMLNSLIFDFFWKTKCELVTRAVVVQPPSLGGFSVVNVKLKVSSLLSQWVRRFAANPSGWTLLMTYWFLSSFGTSPSVVLARPNSFNHSILPAFYSSLLLAWRSLDGSFDNRLSSLVFASRDPHACRVVADLSSKIGYLFLLDENYAVPHCVEKFRPTFGALYWPSTWRQLHFANFDRSVLDFSWKVAHGVVLTAQRLISFGLHVSQHCFCGPVLESLSHLLFACPLAQSVLSWLQSLMFRYSPMSPVLLLRHVLFGFNLEELRLLPRVFVYILNVCKFCIWLARNDFRFRSLQPGAIPVIESVKARVKFHLTVFFKQQRTARGRRFFTRRWGANGVIASFAGGNLTFAL